MRVASIKSRIREDMPFIKVCLMPYFRIEKLAMEPNDSPETYPDIWVTLNGVFPIITVTGEWASQDVDERRKRLVHECLHIRGMNHDEKIGYSTYPRRDTFSKRVYERIKEEFGL